MLHSADAAGQHPAGTAPPAPTSATSTSTPPTKPPTLRPATQCVAVAAAGDPRHHGATSVPIFQSATFAGSAEYDYSRSGNPTRSALEAHLARLMHAQRAFSVSSGMAALDIVLKLVSPGDEVVTGDDLYGGTNRLLAFLEKQAGIVVHHVDTTNNEQVLAKVSPRTRLVLLETPTNPLLKIADIRTIAAAVKRRNSAALVMVDNTMMSPLLQRPLDLGADITYHSGTKYLSGHHDLMAGVIGVNDAELAEKIYFIINATGSGLPPFECFLLLRGIKTLAIRVERQQSNAQRIAEHIAAKHTRFRVNYPGLAQHPQHALHFSIASGAGAVLSFQTGDAALSQRIVDAARLWTVSVSFGLPCTMSHASIPAHIRRERNLPECVVRLCVGIEDVHDLIEDLDRAIDAAERGHVVGSVAASPGEVKLE